MVRKIILALVVLAVAVVPVPTLARDGGQAFHGGGHEFHGGHERFEHGFHGGGFGFYTPYSDDGYAPGRLLLRTRRASAGPCFIRAAGRCADREPASRATGKREHGGDCKRDRPYRSHQGCGPLSALTFASLASTSAMRFCTRRMCHSSHSRRVSRPAASSRR